MTLQQLVRAVVFAMGGFLLATAISYVLVLQFSPRQDREPEAAMTSFFFYGPAGAVVAFALGLFYR